MARVVLDAGAVAELAHHLEVERRPLPQPSALERPTLGLELADADLHLGLDVDDRFLELVIRRDVVGRREDVRLLALREQLAGQRVQLGDPLDDIAEELDADERLLRGRLEFQRVAADAEPGAGERLVVALVLEVDEMSQDRVAPVLAADPELEHGRAVVDRGAQAVDAADAGDDDHVAALEQRVRRGVAESVDLVVARRVLLDVGVAPRQVGLGLVVVEVADEVLDRVLGEELAELGVELGGQRLVVGQDQRGLLVLFDDPGDAGRLSGPGGSEQGLVSRALGEALAQALDGGRLVPGGLEGRDELEVGHRPQSSTERGSNRTGVRTYAGSFDSTTASSNSSSTRSLRRLGRVARVDDPWSRSVPAARSCLPGWRSGGRPRPRTCPGAGRARAGRSDRM